MTWHLLDEALQEAREARQWYEARNPEVAASFERTLWQTLDRLAETPALGAPHLLETRRWILHGFPYVSVYVARGDGIVVLAVAHTRRRPAYWRKRILEQP